MVKILHTADMHLDSPFTLSDASLSQARRADLRSDFCALMMYVKDQKIDLLLIAGDMFEHEYATKETVELVTKEFARVPECRIIIAPGNHDPYTPTSIYKKAQFPDNVYIFNESTPSSFYFEDLNTQVHGYAFTSSVMERNPFVGNHPLYADRINILLGHGDTSSPISKYCPITESDIADSGYDYMALGHIHAGKEPTRVGDTVYAYCGCLEGRDYSEAGHKGALYGEFIKDENGFRYDIKPIRFSKRRYASHRLNVTGCCETEELIKEISQKIISKGYGEDTLLRVILEGNVSPSLVISKPEIEAGIRKLYSFELVDKTLPLFDIDRLKNDPTIKGAFFDALLPLLEGEDREQRETAALALRYGLGAIDGNDIIDF